MLPGRRPENGATCPQTVHIDGGLGQCIAQMVAAQVYNERAGQPIEAVYGCVTTGEVWQFLQLVDQRVTLHSTRLYIDNTDLLLAASGRRSGTSW